MVSNAIRADLLQPNFLVMKKKKQEKLKEKLKEKERLKQSAERSSGENEVPEVTVTKRDCRQPQSASHEDGTSATFEQRS